MSEKNAIIHLSYVEHEGEQYVKVNDMITFAQKLSIQSDDDVDRVLPIMSEKEDPDMALFNNATNDFGKKTARKITKAVIEALDGLETDFEVKRAKKR